MKICSVGGCNRPHRAKGLCMMHYKRLRGYGSLDRTKKGAHPHCEVCGEPTTARGLCHRHYYTWLRHGDPRFTDNKRALLSETYIDDTGYEKTRGGKGVPYHRIVAGAGPNEVVHHINGIKSDNRLENLHVYTNNSDHFYGHASLHEIALQLNRIGLIGFDKNTGRYCLEGDALSAIQERLQDFLGEQGRNPVTDNPASQG